MKHKIIRNRKVHEFSNGVKVFDDHLLELQRERYAKNNVHEAEEEAFFLVAIHKLQRDAVFVNVGSAIGYYCILAKLTRPDLTIHAYEPLKQHRKFMWDNMKLNGLRKRDTALHEEGIDSEAGAAAFAVLNFSSMIVKSKEIPTWKTKFIETLNNNRIKTITLEEVVNRSGGSIDLLQMDIQGLEKPVFESSKKLLQTGCIRNILVGTHSKDIHEAVLKVLEACNFQIEISIPEAVLQPDGIILATHAGT